MDTKANLSSAAWAVHDLGLATAIGGTLFGRTALQPALSEIAGADERDLVSAKAWQRFSCSISPPTRPLQARGSSGAPCSADARSARAREL
jgi:hypothetical protein